MGASCGIVKKPDAARQVILPLRKTSYQNIPVLSIMRKTGIGPFFRAQILRRDEKEIEKWNRMVGRYESENFPLEAYLENDSAMRTFSKRLEKGPPPQYRWQAWIATRHLSTKISEKVYESLSCAPLIYHSLLQHAVSQLYPGEPYYHSAETAQAGQDAVLRLLLKLMGKYPELECGTGLEQITGFALLVSGGNEVETFFFIEDLLVEGHLKGFYSGSHGYYTHCAGILEESLHKHVPGVVTYLEQCGAQGCVQEWLLRLFTSTVPLETVTRVWDCYMAHGIRMLFKVTVAFLRLQQADILSLQPNEVKEFLATSALRSIDTELLIHQAFRVSINARKLLQLQTPVQDSSDRSLPHIKSVSTTPVPASHSSNDLLSLRQPSRSLTSKVPALPQIRKRYEGHLFTWDTAAPEEEVSVERPVAAREVLEELLRDDANLSALSLESLSNLPPKPTPKVNELITFVSTLPL